MPVGKKSPSGTECFRVPTRTVIRVLVLLQWSLGAPGVGSSLVQLLPWPCHYRSNIAVHAGVVRRLPERERWVRVQRGASEPRPLSIWSPVVHVFYYHVDMLVE